MKIADHILMQSRTLLGSVSRIMWRCLTSTFDHENYLLLRSGRGSVYCDQFVCLCVCLSVRAHISGTAGPIFTNFCADPLWPWLGPGGVAILYVLPVL